MFYAVYVPPYCDLPDGEEEKPQAHDLIFSEIKEAYAALKRYKDSRMKSYPTREKALKFLQDPGSEESFMVESFVDADSSGLNTSFEKMSINPHSSPKSPSTNMTTASNLNSPSALFASPTKPLQKPHSTATASPTTTTTSSTATTTNADEAEPAYPSAKTAMLNQLRRTIESGDLETVRETIWSNPRCLVSVSDKAIHLMAGPKYNACHIAARANKPDIMALLLETVSTPKFLRKLYPKDSVPTLQDRVKHLLDSYLNTPDPRQGNTPLHFACKLGHSKVVKVLLAYEGCDLSLRDSNGQTAEESICNQYRPPKVDLTEQFKEKLNLQGDGKNNQSSTVAQQIRHMFKQHYNRPLYRDQLIKKLDVERRRSLASSDTSFSDIDDSFYVNSPTKQNKTIS